MVSKLHQEDPKKDFRCPNKFKMVKWWPQIQADELQAVARWVQGGPRWDARWVQEGSRGPQAGPNWTQGATQMENLVFTKMSKSFESLLENEGWKGLNGGHGTSLVSY